jgi:hypothetical protein
MGEGFADAICFFSMGFGGGEATFFGDATGAGFCTGAGLADRLPDAGFLVATVYLATTGISIFSGAGDFLCFW